jgi:hypothetical protein
LVRIDVHPGLSRVCAGQDTRVGERHQRNRTTTDNHGAEVREADQGYGEGRQALRQGTEHLHPGGTEVQRADSDRRRHHCDQNAGDSLEALEHEDHYHRASTDREYSTVSTAVENGPGDAPKVAQRPISLNRDSEHFGQLVDQHGERDAVHIAVANRLGEQFSDEPQPEEARQNTHYTRHHRHHAGQSHGARRIATGVRQHDCQYHGGEGRIRPEHKDAAGTEQRVSQQRDHGGVQPVDARDSGRLRVCDSGRDKHRGQH